jgi:hypothetical protein
MPTPQPSHLGLRQPLTVKMSGVSAGTSDYTPRRACSALGARIWVGLPKAADLVSRSTSPFSDCRDFRLWQVSQKTDCFPRPPVRRLAAAIATEIWAKPDRPAPRCLATGRRSRAVGMARPGIRDGSGHRQPAAGHGGVQDRDAAMSRRGDGVKPVGLRRTLADRLLHEIPSVQCESCAGSGDRIVGDGDVVACWPPRPSCCSTRTTYGAALQPESLPLEVEALARQPQPSRREVHSAVRRAHRIGQRRNLDVLRDL